MNQLTLTEIKITQFLARNDPSLISQLLDIPYDKCAEACQAYKDAAIHSKEYPMSYEDFARFIRQVLASLMNEAQRHD